MLKDSSKHMFIQGPTGTVVKRQFTISDHIQQNYTSSDKFQL